MNRILHLGLIAAVGVAGVAVAAPATPYYLPFGLDLTAADRATKPGDDPYYLAVANPTRQDEKRLEREYVASRG